MKKKKIELHRCGGCGRLYSDTQLLKCPATDRYACYYCCKRCNFHTKHPMCGAIGCSYNDNKIRS